MRASVERWHLRQRRGRLPVRATAATLPARAHPRRDAGTRAGYGCRTGTDRPDPQAAAVLGRRFWELLAEANRQQVDLTVALTETLAGSTPHADDNAVLDTPGHTPYIPNTFVLAASPVPESSVAGHGNPNTPRDAPVPHAQGLSARQPITTPRHDTSIQPPDTMSRTSDNSFSNTSDRLPISRWASRSSAPKACGCSA